MGDPKQDLKGFGNLRRLVDVVSQGVDYITECHRCPQTHLDISNRLVAASERQHSCRGIEGSLSVIYENDVDVSSTINNCIVNIRTNTHVYDDEKEVSEDDIKKINANIYNLLLEEAKKCESGEISNNDDITSIRFGNLNKAVKFIFDYKNKLEEYKDNKTEYNLIIDNKIAIIDIPENKELNLNLYISDIFDYAYNQEIIVNDAIKDELLDSVYGFEFLGDKQLRKSEITQALYKMTI